MGRGGFIFTLLVTGIMLFKAALFLMATMGTIWAAGFMWQPAAGAVGIKEKTITDFFTVNLKRLEDTGFFVESSTLKQHRELAKQKNQIEFERRKAELERQKTELLNQPTPSPDSRRPSTWGYTRYSDPSDVLSHLPSIYDRQSNEQYCQSLEKKYGHAMPVESGRSRSLPYAQFRNGSTGKAVRTECRRDGRWYTVRLWDNSGYDIMTYVCPSPPPCSG